MEFSTSIFLSRLENTVDSKSTRLASKLSSSYNRALSCRLSSFVKTAQLCSSTCHQNRVTCSSNPCSDSLTSLCEESASSLTFITTANNYWKISGQLKGSSGMILPSLLRVTRYRNCYWLVVKRANRGYSDGQLVRNSEVTGCSKVVGR